MVPLQLYCTYKSCHFHINYNYLLLLLRIVIHVTGDEINADSSLEISQVLQENTDQLPLPVEQVSVGKFIIIVS